VYIIIIIVTKDVKSQISKITKMA